MKNQENVDEHLKQYCCETCTLPSVSVVIRFVSNNCS